MSSIDIFRPIRYNQNFTIEVLWQIKKIFDQMFALSSHFRESFWCLWNGGKMLNVANFKRLNWVWKHECTIKVFFFTSLSSSFPRNKISVNSHVIFTFSFTSTIVIWMCIFVCCCCLFDYYFEKLATTHTNGPSPWTFISFTCLRFQGTRKLTPSPWTEWVCGHLYWWSRNWRSYDLWNEPGGNQSWIEKVG